MLQLLADLEPSMPSIMTTRRMTSKRNSVDRSGIVPAEGQLYRCPFCCRFRAVTDDPPHHCEQIAARPLKKFVRLDLLYRYLLLFVRS